MKRKAQADAERKAAQTQAEQQKQSMIDIAEAEEAKRKLAEQQEARRLAALEKEKLRKQRQAAWEARCVIKPAMSDEEIEICREVRTKPAP